MPMVILLVGMILATAAVRGTHKELGELWKTQFTGEGSFIAWAFALVMIALLGTIEQLRPLARAFMVLILIVLILVHSRETNIFTLIQAQLLGRVAMRGAAASSGNRIGAAAREAGEQIGQAGRNVTP